MTADDSDRQDPEPERERRLPPPRGCDQCGRRRAEWVCRACQLRLCSAHRVCPACDGDRDR